MPLPAEMTDPGRASRRACDNGDGPTLCWKREIGLDPPCELEAVHRGALLPDGLVRPLPGHRFPRQRRIASAAIFTSIDSPFVPGDSYEKPGGPYPGFFPFDGVLKAKGSGN